LEPARTGAGLSRRHSWLVLILLTIVTACVPQPLSLDRQVEGTDYQAPGMVSYPPDLLREVAAALAAKGLYDRRPVHGFAMQNSLRIFQDQQGLPVTGLIDAGTLQALEMDPQRVPPRTVPAPPRSTFLADFEARVHQITGGLPVGDHERFPGQAAQAPFAPSHFPLQTAVAALVNAQGHFCTGFLVAPEILLTSRGCLETRAQCEQTVARFHIQENEAGLKSAAVDYRCLEIMEVGELLDYAAVRLEGEPGLDWGYLTLSERPPTQDEPVAVIGHPTAGAGTRIYNDCLVVEAGGRPGQEMKIACGAEIKLTGAPVISRWHNRVFGLLPPGKVPPAAPGAGLAVGLLSAECRLCEPIGIGSPMVGFSTSRGYEFLVSKPAGFSLLRSGQGGFTIDSFQPDWLNKWNLHGKYRVHAADLDGNGHHDLVLHNSRWLAIFKRDKDRLRLHWISHDRVGDWQLSAADQVWPGDFNGDGRTDLLFFGGQRLGVLLAEGQKLVCAWLGGPALGEWRFQSGDRFYTGDFNGDGRHDILVRRGDKAAVFSWRGNQLVQVWVAASRLDAWQLHGADEHYIGDFTGDGSHEVLVRRDRLLSLWKMTGEQVRVQWVRQGRWGGWPLGRQDKLLIADFNGNGRDDVLIRSSRGIALQISEGGFFSTSWIRFNRFEGWILSPFDRALAADSSQGGGTAVLLFNPWASGRFVFTGTTLVKDFVIMDPLSEGDASTQLY
jgi:hypothetical protein